MFFFVPHRNEIGESANKYQLLGLNLIFLLSQNRVAEFHTELELLPQEIIQSNEYIRHPLILEQHLMEGNYNKIFAAKVSDDLCMCAYFRIQYSLFIQILFSLLEPWSIAVQCFHGGSFGYGTR